MKLINNLSVVFNFSACKDNKVPTHYHTGVKQPITVDAIATELLANPDRTIYTVMLHDGIWYYTANNSTILETVSFTTYVKPAPIAKVKPVTTVAAPAIEAPLTEKREIKILKHERTLGEIELDAKEKAEYEQYLIDCEESEETVLPQVFDIWKRTNLNPYNTTERAPEPTPIAESIEVIKKNHSKNCTKGKHSKCSGTAASMKACECECHTR